MGAGRCGTKARGVRIPPTLIRCGSLLLRCRRVGGPLIPSRNDHLEYIIRHILREHLLGVKYSRNQVAFRNPKNTDLADDIGRHDPAVFVSLRLTCPVIWNSQWRLVQPPRNIIPPLVQRNHHRRLDRILTIRRQTLLEETFPSARSPPIRLVFVPLIHFHRRFRR